MSSEEPLKMSKQDRAMLTAQKQAETIIKQLKAQSRIIPVIIIAEKETLRIVPPKVQVNPGEQLAWTCPNGRLEIRFNPRDMPFASNSYEVPSGGMVFSGVPIKSRQRATTYTYTVLVTSKDGLFLTGQAEVVIAASIPNR